MSNKDGAQNALKTERAIIEDIVVENLKLIPAEMKENEEAKKKEREEAKKEQTPYNGSVLLTNSQLKNMIASIKLMNKQTQRLDDDVIPDMQAALLDFFRCLEYMLRATETLDKETENAVCRGVSRILNEVRDEVRTERTEGRKENHGQVTELVQKLEKERGQWMEENRWMHYISTAFTAMVTCIVMEWLPPLAKWICNSIM